MVPLALVLAKVPLFYLDSPKSDNLLCIYIIYNLINWFNFLIKIINYFIYFKNLEIKIYPFLNYLIN